MYDAEDFAMDGPRSAHQDAVAPTTTARIPTIDALRGVAVLAVLVSHLPFTFSRVPGAPAAIAVSPSVDAAMKYGIYGVHLFLVISGFCIHMGWARKGDTQARVDFGDFWQRRLRRLYPPYFLALCLSLAGLFVLYGVLGGHRESLTSSLGYASIAQLALDLVLLLLLAQNFSDASQRIGNGPFWTLALEEQLYALYFPFLHLRRRAGWRTTLATVAVVTVAWRGIALFVAPFEVGEIMLVLGPARWLEWALGALAVEAHLGTVTLPRALRTPALAAFTLAAGIALHPASHAAGMGGKLARLLLDTTFGFSMFVWVSYACRVRWADAARSVGRSLAWVGVFSYSLYLTHQPAIVVAKIVGLKAGLGVLGVIVLRAVAALAVGFLYFTVVERRFLGRTRRATITAR